MNKRWRRFQRWFDARPVLHRLAATLAAAATVWFAFDQFWLLALDRSLRQQEATIASLSGERDLLADQLAILEHSEADDPDAALRAGIESEDQRIAELDARLREQTLEILSPEQMKTALRDLIAGVDGLELTDLETVPPEALLGAIGDAAPTLFRHGLRLGLSGEYPALVAALQRLESAPWRFYWSGLNLAADDDGPRRFRLFLYTVSLREEWIRV